MLNIGIIRERKNPPDMRVPLTPAQCGKLKRKFGDEVVLTVEPSDIRIFEDGEYKREGIPVSEGGVRNSDILLGVKEVPPEHLIPNKTYFFFSHTIKEQPYNRNLLRAILDKNIRLIDWECLRKNGDRILGFGRHAGIVGAYNGLLAFGKRYDLYDLKPAHKCRDRDELERGLENVKLPPIKIALTGRGRVAGGAIDILEKAGIKRVEPEVYLTGNFDEPVYAQLGVEHYNKPKDAGVKASREHFFKHYTEYESDFFRFARVTDLFIAGHFYAEGSPPLITREEAKSPEFKIKVVADISCDIDGPVAPTIRPSTIEDPIYGYDPVTGNETDFKNENAVTVMAVDNLPCELPRDASHDFGEEFISGVFPELLNGDKNDILAGATIAESGKLTPKFAYLKNYVEGGNV